MELTKKRRSPKFFEFTQIIAVIISAIVAAIAFYASSTDKRLESQVFQSERYEMQAMEMRSEIAKLKQVVDTLTQSSKKGAITSNVKAIETSLQDIQTRQEKIEAVILQNPSKALEMPLLRRDMDNLKDNQQTLLTTVKQDIDRLYDLNKWLLGAMAISIITLAITNYLKGKEKA